MKHLLQTLASVLTVCIVLSRQGAVLCAAPAVSWEGMEYIGVDDDVGDHMYFSSNDYETDRIRDGIVTLVKANIQPKEGNEIEIPAIKDYFNKEERKKNWIRMVKNSNNDPLLDIYTGEKAYIAESSKRERYYLISATIKMVNLNGEAYMFQIRDDSGSVQQNVYLSKLSGAGSMTLSDGTVIGNVAVNDTWFDYKAAIDLGAHTYDIYINGEKRASAVPFTDQFNFLSMVRWIMPAAATRGETWVKDWTIVGLTEPYVDGKETMTSIFHDDAPLEAYMKDKIGLAYYGSVLYANGQKTKWKNRILYRDGEMYLPAIAIQLAFPNRRLQFDGSQVRADGEIQALEAAPVLHNGEWLYPIGGLARGFGLFPFDDGKGMLLIADHELHYDLSDRMELDPVYRYTEPELRRKFGQLQELSKFLSYDRPKAERIETLFAQYQSTRPAAHPRIFINQERFAFLRENAQRDSALRRIYSRYMDGADALVNRIPEPVDYVFGPDQPHALLQTAREFLSRMEQLGFAWQMTRDPKYAERAWKELKSVSTFPDWNYQHALDMGELGMASAIGYDWMYDAWTPEQRALIEDMIYRLGLHRVWLSVYGRVRPSSEHNLAGSGGWVFKCGGNFNTVLAGGSIAMAMALADVNAYAGEAFDVAEKAIRGVEYSLSSFWPSGGWGEGAMYSEYAVKYLMRGLLSLEYSLGTDFDIMESTRGLERYPDYLVAMRSYQGGNPMHDGVVSKGLASNCFPYFAAVYQRPELMALVRQDWEVAGIHEDADLDLAAAYLPGADLSLTQRFSSLTYVPGVELFSLRSDLGDSGAAYLSAHFGSVAESHTHYDTGVFVLDMMGERWAEELDKPNHGMTVTADWQVYRRRTEGHSTFTINNGPGHNQNLAGFAPVVRRGQGPGGAYVTADMSSIYDDVSQMQMGYFASEDVQSVAMRGEMELRRPSEVYWFLYTKADIKLDQDGRRAIFTKNGKQLSVQLASNAAMELSVMDAVPLESSQIDLEATGQDPNPGFRKLAVRMEAEGHLTLTAVMTPLGKETPEMLTLSLADWEGYSSGGPYVKRFEVKKTGEQFQAAVQVYRCPGAVLAAAEYDKAGVLLNLQTWPLEDTRDVAETFRPRADNTCVRFYLWRSLEDAVPLCPAVSSE